MARLDRRKALRPARPAAAEPGPRFAAHGMSGGYIDSAFVEDPLTGGTVSTRRRGRIRTRKDKWYDGQLKRD